MIDFNSLSKFFLHIYLDILDFDSETLLIFFDRDQFTEVIIVLIREEQQIWSFAMKQSTANC